MNCNICPDCDNFMFTYTDVNTNQLYNACKVCSNVTPMDSDSKFIYKTNFDIDKSKILNTNKYIANDITLPSIKNNKNIKCVNSECKSIKENLPCNIIYIKYDTKNIKFMYICQHCGHKWTNK